MIALTVESLQIISRLLRCSRKSERVRQVLNNTAVISNPRPEYHFTTREEMTKAIAAGEFIESAEYSGNLYGTR